MKTFKLQLRDEANSAAARWELFTFPEVIDVRVDHEGALIVLSSSGWPDLGAWQAALARAGFEASFVERTHAAPPTDEAA